MTLAKLFSALLMTAAFVALADTSAPAAPVPKGAGTGEATPDLTLFFDTVGKAVRAEKWPEADDEKILRWTAEKVLARTLKAAEQKDRKLPVEFDKLTKLPVTANYTGKLDNQYLVVGTARITTAKNSVVFATGHVQITTATNCVVIAPSVRITGFDNCVVVAGDFFRFVSARHKKDADRSVVVAGQWVRGSTMLGTICHVLRPGTTPAPDEKGVGANMAQPAVTANTARDVIFLNASGDVRAANPALKGAAVADPAPTYLPPPKAPIAK